MSFPYSLYKFQLWFKKCLFKRKLIQNYRLTLHQYSPRLSCPITHHIPPPRKQKRCFLPKDSSRDRNVIPQPLRVVLNEKIKLRLRRKRWNVVISAGLPANPLYVRGRFAPLAVPKQYRATVYLVNAWSGIPECCREFRVVRARG